METTESPHASVAYLLVGRHFVAKAEQWSGAVVASREALYLIKAQAEMRAPPAMLVLHAFLPDPSTALFEWAVAPALLPNPPMWSERNLKSCFYNELPLEVTGHPDWPLPYAAPDWAVIIIAREQVNALRLSLLRGSFAMTVRRIRYRVYIPLIRRRSALKFLREAGWLDRESTRG